jgi:hypothetical protein
MFQNGLKNGEYQLEDLGLGRFHIVYSCGMDWDIWMEYFFHNIFSKMVLFCIKTKKRQDEHLGVISVRVIVVSIRTNF